MTGTMSIAPTSAQFSRRRFLAATTAASHLGGSWTTFAQPSAANQSTPTNPWPDARLIPATALVGVTGGATFAADTNPLDLSGSELSECAGRFATPVDAVSLRVDGDQLLITLEAIEMAGYIAEAVSTDLVVDYPVSVISGDRLAIGQNMVASFIRKPDGEIGWIRTSVRAAPKVRAR